MIADRVSSDVEQFFDRIANRYADFYQSGKNNLHVKRLRLAMNDLLLTDKSVLDIGAGTGALYNEIVKAGGCREYLGIDVSKQMLALSAIPQDAQLNCHFLDAELSKKYDVIFALGLTNYLSPADNLKLRDLIYDTIQNGGQAIISYTNANNISNTIRKKLHRSTEDASSWTSISGCSRSFFTPAEIHAMWANTSEWCYFNHNFGRPAKRTNFPIQSDFYTDFLVYVKG